MSIIPLLLGTLSGICIATGIIFLFTGLRRSGQDRVQILFSLFAFSYAGANLTSVLEYKTTTLEGFMRMGDLTALFTVLTLVFLLWFVSAYTKVAPRVFLIALTFVLGMVAVVAISRPTSVYDEIFGVVTATLPWGETITQLDASESIWGILFFLSQFTLIGFLVFACIKQFLRGERRDAFILSLGLLFLILALVFDMLFIDSGAINFIYLGDFGFIPLLVIISLQLSDQVIRTDEELASYQQNLKQMVADRTQELEETASALLKSERQTRALVDAPPDTAMLVTPNGDILATNHIGATRLGLTVETAIGKNVFSMFDADLAALRKNKAQEAISSKQPVEWEDQRASAFYHSRMYPVLDEKGEVESIAIFAFDITEQKQTEEDLRRRVEELRCLNLIITEIASHTEVVSALQRASESITDLFQGRCTHIIYASNREQNLEIMCGFDTEAGPLDPQPILVPLHDLPLVKDVMEKGKSIIAENLSELPLPAEIETFFVESQIKRIMLVPLFVKGQVIGVIAVSGSDRRTGFNEHELSLLEAIASYIAAAIQNARLAYANVETATTEERNRLARDLHDAVTQTIYAASLIAESLPQIWERSPEEGERNLFKLRQLVRGALAEMRSLLFELRPASLEKASIDTLIQFVADAFSGRTRVPVTMKVEGFGHQPADVKTAIYRITQEIFNNITKHAQATSVEVDLENGAQKITLSIWDNGMGFNPEENEDKGMGLSILQERAADIGAQLKIESQVGQGTCVTIQWADINEDKDQ